MPSHFFSIMLSTFYRRPSFFGRWRTATDNFVAVPTYIHRIFATSYVYTRGGQEVYCGSFALTHQWPPPPPQIVSYYQCVPKIWKIERSSKLVYTHIRVQIYVNHPTYTLVCIGIYIQIYERIPTQYSLISPWRYCPPFLSLYFFYFSLRGKFIQPPLPLHPVTRTNW